MNDYEIIKMVQRCNLQIERLESEVEELRGAPEDNGIEELDSICQRFNKGEIGLSQLVCTIWNVASLKNHNH